MDDNARPHRARIVREFRQEAIDTFQWLAMSHDMNPIEHIWDRKVNQRNPHRRSIVELTKQFWKNGGDS
jgi:hypothetical protein